MCISFPPYFDHDAFTKCTYWPPLFTSQRHLTLPASLGFPEVCRQISVVLYYIDNHGVEPDGEVRYAEHIGGSA